jgi:hypothetical protein
MGLGRSGSLTALRSGRVLQSSIRSCGADQGVVRCSGAQSSGRPSCGSEAMTNVELARACASRRCRGRKPCCVSARRCSCGNRQLLFRARAAAARQATDLSVAQAVVGEGEDLARDGDLGDLAPAALGDPLELLAQRPDPVVIFCAASTSAQRRAGEPWREMCPRRALPSELRTVGVSPPTSTGASRWSDGPASVGPEKRCSSNPGARTPHDRAPASRP